MKTCKLLLLAGLVMVSGSLYAPQAAAQSAAPQTLDQLLEQIRNARSEAAAENRQREQEFLAARNQQRALLEEAQAALAAEEARSERLQNVFDANEQKLTNMAETLRSRMGNLGEVFGIVRQVAGNVKSVVDASLVSAQLEAGRSQFLSKMAQSSALPSIEELERMWVIILEEMNLAGKVVRFPSEVISNEGQRYQTEVVRVGVFNAVVEDRFLNYLPETGALVELARQPQDRYRDMAEELYGAPTDAIVPMAIDPTGGTLLSLLVETPSIMERVTQGGVVGYVIIALGIIGLLVAIERIVYFTIAGGKIRSQLGSSKPSGDNPLGRVLSVYSDNKTDDVETLELKMDEAIMKEVPALEARLSFVKLIAAVGPLLGLLGTVTGMIATFQSITLFGTGDPKLMAGGISMALVTTVLGLCVAIPLVLIHGYLATRSKALVQILEEQSAGIIAAHAEKRK
ncbi:MAG TPA: MotA/TolQ/ExbB proton channel family protein [Gammaproteobacteria bacterium]|nr:MotA/TolQ/ExbB proton channel family protein [Gammaproteobacteria bacterium]